MSTSFMRRNSSFVLTAIAAVAVAIGTSESAAAAPTTFEWRDTDIGQPPVPGSSQVAGSSQSGDHSLRIIGSGTGTHQKGDQLHFTSMAHPGGDVEIVARLSAFEGPDHARAGIMLRSGTSPDAPIATVEFCFRDTKEGDHAVRWMVRDPAGTGDGKMFHAQSGIRIRQSPPLWLRLTRLGSNFAVAKSPDGKLWSPLGNTGGSQFVAEGPLEVGFFVAGGPGQDSATATFDEIRIGPPRLDHRTSWVGNSFGGNRSDRHVSNHIGSLWTAPDGSCYTNAFWDEGGGEAIKLYRDGRVVKSFRDGNEAFGNGFCGEGSITGDGSHVYAISNRHLWETDMLGTAAATKPLYLTIDPFDKAKGMNILCGLAKVGEELFVGDARDNCIRVVRPDAFTPRYLAGNTTVNIAAKPVDTAGVVNAAPPIVYQSQRETDYTPYVVSGLETGKPYTIRCHFAEYKEEKPGRRLINIGGSQTKSLTAFDVVAAAGGPFKAAVVDLPGAKPDASGKLSVVFERGAGGNGHIVVCGFEVLAADGKRVFALNCGGPAVDGFEGELHEGADRRFAFDRPGTMAVDSRGHLWITQRANDFPSKAETTTARYPAAIKCFKPDGTFTGRQIADIVNPAGLAYDAVNDRLLVAENGPDQNIRIYDHLASKPALADTFGVKQGIYAGSHPGRVADPAAGGDARFCGLTGVGVDEKGGIYVSSGLQGTDLRKFTPDGVLAWRLNSLMFCNTPDVDPDSDGTEIYSTYVHMGLDLDKTAAGREWSLKSYSWDAGRFGKPVRQGNSQAIVRRVGPDRKLVLYTSGQGQVESAKIFRYEGEIAIPCGEVQKNGTHVWVDTNGDGRETPDEVQSHKGNGSLSSFAVDDRGDIWLALIHAGPQPPIVRHFRMLGLTPHGGPRYGTADGEVEDIPFPGNGAEKTPRGWGNGCKVDYDVATDAMILIGPDKSRENDKEDPIQYMARYDDWSKGNRTPRWRFRLPNPDTDPNFMYEVGRPWGCTIQFQAMDAAGDKIFLASLWGEVHVYDSLTGKRDTILSCGPEVSGCSAWEDASMGIRAFKRKNGEYLVFTENSGFGGRSNFYRWKP
jgi:hypothetical protein